MITASSDNPVADCIAMVVVVLMAIGTVFVFSASANIGQELDLHRFYDYPGLRQLVFFPLACLIMYTVSAINYRRLSLAGGWLKSPTSYLLVLSIVLLALVLSQRFYPFLPRLVPKINQHYRWLKIPLGPIAVSFQPSELAKWVIVFFLADISDKYGDEIKLY